MNIVNKIVYILLIIGGLNWGIMGFFDYNVIDGIFSTEVSRIIYGAVGIAALFGLYALAAAKPKKAKS